MVYNNNAWGMWRSGESGGRNDTTRVKIAARNRKGDVSVLLESLDGELAHLVTKGLKLANEIFLGFLKGPYSEYMVENSQEPED